MTPPPFDPYADFNGSRLGRVLADRRADAEDAQRAARAEASARTPTAARRTGRRPTNLRVPPPPPVPKATVTKRTPTGSPASSASASAPFTSYVMRPDRPWNE